MRPIVSARVWMVFCILHSGTNLVWLLLDRHAQSHFAYSSQIGKPALVIHRMDIFFPVRAYKRMYSIFAEWSVIGPCAVYCRIIAGQLGDNVSAAQPASSEQQQHVRSGLQKKMVHYRSVENTYVVESTVYARGDQIYARRKMKCIKN